MGYDDSSTRKRPAWEEIIAKVGAAYVRCSCEAIIMTKQGLFDHWQQGHFDTYDVKEQ